jgi:DNA mismatch repair protein MutS
MELEKKIEHAEVSGLKRELELLDSLALFVLSFKDDLLKAAETLAYIDVSATNAVLAIKNNYVRPVFSKEKVLTVVKGRHPVVEISLDDDMSHFCANDCVLTHEERRFLLVTGPNMAGKSTYLRQNAIIIVMAQAGMFVPAESAEIGIVDKIFSRIGASDDLAAGKSTFMVEMIETAAILNQATDKSFVILDEVGRGTATYDGLSIALAVSEYIYEKIQCRTLFATHYHELTKISEYCNAVVPVTALTKEWEDKIIFLHTIVDGSAQKSYGIHVAQLAGLPKAVIHRATEVLGKLETGPDIGAHIGRKIVQKRKTEETTPQKNLF